MPLIIQLVITKLVMVGPEFVSLLQEVIAFPFSFLAYCFPFKLVARASLALMNEFKLSLSL